MITGEEKCGDGHKPRLTFTVASGPCMGNTDPTSIAPNGNLTNAPSQNTGWRGVAGLTMGMDGQALSLCMSMGFMDAVGTLNPLDDS
jgi:hypothetical protein